MALFSTTSVCLLSIVGATSSHIADGGPSSSKGSIGWHLFSNSAVDTRSVFSRFFGGGYGSLVVMGAVPVWFFGFFCCELLTLYLPHVVVQVGALYEREICSSNGHTATIYHLSIKGGLVTRRDRLLCQRTRLYDDSWRPLKLQLYDGTGVQRARFFDCQPSSRGHAI